MEERITHHLVMPSIGPTTWMAVWAHEWSPDLDRERRDHPVPVLQCTFSRPPLNPVRRWCRHTYGGQLVSTLPHLFLVLQDLPASFFKRLRSLLAWSLRFLPSCRCRFRIEAKSVGSGCCKYSTELSFSEWSQSPTSTHAGIEKVHGFKMSITSWFRCACWQNGFFQRHVWSSTHTEEKSMEGCCLHHRYHALEVGSVLRSDLQLGDKKVTWNHVVPLGWYP